MTTSAAGARPVAVKLSSDAKDRVARLAAARDRTSHWLMKEAIMEYLDREEKREAFRSACLRAWEECEYSRG